MFNYPAHYTKLKPLLKTSWQRQDSTLQQLVDLEPAFSAMRLTAIVDRIGEMDQHGLVDSGYFTPQLATLQLHQAPADLPLPTQYRLARDVANLLGCYDAADLLKTLSEQTS